MGTSMAGYFRGAAKMGDGKRRYTRAGLAYTEFDLTPGEVAQWPSLAFKGQVRVYANGDFKTGPFGDERRRPPHPRTRAERALIAKEIARRKAAAKHQKRGPLGMFTRER